MRQFWLAVRSQALASEGKSIRPSRCGIRSVCKFLRKTSVVPIVICVFLLSSCLNPFNSSEPPNIAGNWSLSVTSSKFGNQITATGTIAQNGSHISGSFSLAGDPCADAAAMSGTLDGNSINMTLSENGQDVTFTGKVTNNGSSANGPYTAATGGCTNGDTGTWVGNKTTK